MLTHYFNIFIEALKYKHHLIPSLCSCLFIWDNQTTVDTRPAQEPSIYLYIWGPAMLKSKNDKTIPWWGIPNLKVSTMYIYPKGVKLVPIEN